MKTKWRKFVSLFRCHSGRLRNKSESHRLEYLDFVQDENNSSVSYRQSTGNCCKELDEGLEELEIRLRIKLIHTAAENSLNKECWSIKEKLFLLNLQRWIAETKRIWELIIIIMRKIFLVIWQSKFWRTNNLFLHFKTTLQTVLVISIHNWNWIDCLVINYANLS